MKAVPFLPAARAEYLAAIEFYTGASVDLAEDFVEEVERGLERIASFPGHGSPYHAGTRRVVLRRFPFDLVYREVGGAVHVVAVAHHRRSPHYWRKRLK